MTENTKTVNIDYKGKLVGHTGWVTCINSTTYTVGDEKKEVLVSGSRDKNLIVWELIRDPLVYGKAKKSLKGHSHFVSDVVVSSDGSYALSSSWDKSLRLWKLSEGVSTKRFVGHKKDVLSVALSSDNRQIVSGSRDKTIKVWNILGQCKFSLTQNGHSSWVTCVKFSPQQKAPMLISAGYDMVVKVWDLASSKLLTNLIGHTGFISSITVSPDGSLCASGGKDGTAMLWDLNKGEHLYSLPANKPIHCLAFSPTRYWLCAATDDCIKIWNLETKKLVAELVPDAKNLKAKRPVCISFAWSSDGATLYSGYTDNVIRVWGVYSSTEN